MKFYAPLLLSSVEPFSPGRQAPAAPSDIAPGTFAISLLAAPPRRDTPRGSFPGSLERWHVVKVAFISPNRFELGVGVVVSL